MTRKRRRVPRAQLAPWIAAVAVVLVALWLLLANVVLVVRDVRVVGAGEIPESDVRHMSGIRLGSRITAVNADKVRQNVERDGRVVFLGLSRQLPGTVVLKVRPRSADAVILLGGNIVVLDSNGYVVSVTDRVPDSGAVYVTGIRAAYYSPGRQLDQSDGRCAAMKAVLDALKKQGATAYASELSVADTADLRLITRTGMTVRLGNTDDMEKKIAWMAGALADLEARGETTGELDVSSGTKADYAPPTPEPEKSGENAATAEATPEPSGQVYSIDGVIYVDGEPVEAQPTEQPAS